jgi:hypothetical protein
MSKEHPNCCNSAKAQTFEEFHFGQTRIQTRAIINPEVGVESTVNSMRSRYEDW